MHGASAHRGKPFYSMLGFFVAFVILVSVVCVALCQVALDSMGNQARTGLQAVLRMNLEGISRARSVLDFDAVGESLDKDGLLTRLASQTGSISGADAELLSQRIAAMEREVDSIGGSRLYVYLPAADYAAGDEPGDVRTSVPAWVFSDVEGRVENAGGFSVTRFVSDAAGEPNSVRVAGYGDGAYLLYVTYGQPPISGFEHLLTGDDAPEMYYYDSYGSVVPVAGSGRTMAGLYDYDSLGKEPGGSFSFRHDGVTYDCIYETVADSDTRFAIFSPNWAAMAKDELFAAVAVIALVTIVAGSGAAFLAARKLYRPVQGLMASLPTSEVDDGGGAELRDDFKIIGDTLAKQRQSLAMQRSYLQQEDLLRRLHGQSSDFYEAFDADDEETPFYRRPDGRLAVVALHVDARLDECDGVEGRPEFDPEALARELAVHGRQNGYPALCVWDDDLLLAAVDLGGGDVLGLGASLQEFKAAAEKSDGRLLSAYVSSEHYGGDQLHRAYLEAMQACEYCTLLERYNTIQGFDALRTQIGPADGTGVSNEAALYRLRQAIAELDAEEAVRAFNLAAENVSNAGGASPLEARVVFDMLRVTVAQCALELGGTAGGPADGERGPAVAAIMEAPSIGPLRHELEALLEGLSQKEEARARFDGEAFEEILRYVERMAGDPNLSAKMLSDRFGTSQSNMTRLFRKHNGTGFLEYLHGLRIERAKELLRQTDLPIPAVAAQVGYTNPLTLTRAFKRYAGTTPGEYRRRVVGGAPETGAVGARDQ